jgi:hypothetical protein
MTFPSPTSSLRARVVFATFHPGRVNIDLMLARTSMTLDAQVPHRLWALAAAATLDEWARRSVEVELHVGYANGKARAKLTDGTSCMLLDLEVMPEAACIVPGAGTAARI